MKKVEWDRLLDEQLAQMSHGEAVRVKEFFEELYFDKIENGQSEELIIDSFGKPSEVRELMYELQGIEPNRDSKVGATSSDRDVADINAKTEINKGSTVDEVKGNASVVDNDIVQGSDKDVADIKDNTNTVTTKKEQGDDDKQDTQDGQGMASDDRQDSHNNKVDSKDYSVATVESVVVGVVDSYDKQGKQYNKSDDKQDTRDNKSDDKQDTRDNKSYDNSDKQDKQNKQGNDGDNDSKKQSYSSDKDSKKGNTKGGVIANIIDKVVGLVKKYPVATVLVVFILIPVIATFGGAAIGVIAWAVGSIVGFGVAVVAILVSILIIGYLLMLGGFAGIGMSIALITTNTGAGLAQLGISLVAFAIGLIIALQTRVIARAIARFVKWFVKICVIIVKWVVSIVLFNGNKTPNKTAKSTTVTVDASDVEVNK